MKETKWVLLNGIMFALLWVGFTYFPTLKYIMVTITWLYALLSLTVWTNYVETEAAKKVPAYSVPFRVNVAYDLLIVAFFLMHGYIFTAIIWGIQITSIIHLHNRVMELRKQAIDNSVLKE